MKIFKKQGFLFVLALIIGAITVLAALPDARHEQKEHSKQQISLKEASDVYVGPVVDYDNNYNAMAVLDPEQRALREVRGRRYNKESPKPLGEFPPELEGYDISSHWYIGLPALPVS